LALLLPLAATGRATAQATAPEPVQEVRTVWTSEFGVSRPEGLAYSPALDELLVAGAGGSRTVVVRLDRDETRRGSLGLPGETERRTLAFDGARERLTAVQGGDLLWTPARDVTARAPSVRRTDISSLRLQDPRAATFDPSTGTWYVLDASEGAIIGVERPGGTEVSFRIPVSDLGSEINGIAYNASDGLLYVAVSEPDLLYALDGAGRIVRTYDLGTLDLRDPHAIVFAPSSDSTDDPSTQNLFVADAGDTSTLGGVTEITLAQAVTLSAPTATATLVQTIQTSRWSPASPDPSGVVYIPGRDRLEVCDSEVEETTGAGYHGVNLWQVTRSGTVTDTGTTLAYPSKEPTGLGYDAGTNTLFVSDDDAGKVWVVKPGGDGRFGTSDDALSSINASAYGSTDTEDPEFVSATGHLYFLDGVGTEVYDIDPANGVFGDGNDVMRHFDVGQFGPADWEGLGSDPSTGNLLVGARTQKRIYEVTTSGSLVRIIDASGISGMSYISGLAMAPASGGSGRDYWIVDRAVDNGSNASENDGKLFEISVGSTSTNSPPVVTNPGTIANTVGDSVSYQISATDPDGDAITAYGASGLPTGLSVGTTTGLISGATTTQGTFGVTITATDARGATGSASFTWTVSASGSAMTFSPAADTFVGSDRPDRNFGSRSTLTTDASPAKYVLLKFTVSGIGGKTIQAVRLRLYCVNGSPAGGGLYPVLNNSWQESTVTWNNQPAAGSTAVASLGAVSANTWYEVDVTSLVTGDGTYSMRIATPSGNAATYNSKEATPGFASSLVVTLAS
jgi:uncharacterized protein YjiK